MTTKITCPSCEAEFEVSVSFGEAAKTYGPPERCHDGSPDQVEPDECPECGAPVDQRKAIDQAADEAEDMAMDRAERHAEDRKESRLLYHTRKLGL